MLVIPDQSARVLLNSLLDGINTYIHLYVNDVYLKPSITAADLHEAAWPDYSPQLVNTWLEADTENGRAVSVADPVFWTYGSNPSPATVYGYWISSDETGFLLWVEAHPGGGITLVHSSDQIAVFPQLTLKTDPGDGCRILSLCATPFTIVELPA